MPAGPFDLWVILYAARLINLLPASVSRSIAKLNAKGVRLHDHHHPQGLHTHGQGQRLRRPSTLPRC